MKEEYSCMSRGYETVNYSCGCSDIGEKEDGQFVGQIVRKWCDGSIYKGEFNEHYSKIYPNEIMGANGFGRFTFPDGDWHEGTYENNVANGKGIFFHFYKNIYWKGEFLNNMPKGDGLFFRKNLVTSEEEPLYTGQGIVKLLPVIHPIESENCKRIKQIEADWDIWEYWILECED
ncbi:MAG: hypothetical protein ACJ0OP_00580 [Thermodesulfobacteriota bacterium]